MIVHAHLHVICIRGESLFCCISRNEITLQCAPWQCTRTWDVWRVF